MKVLTLSTIFIICFIFSGIALAQTSPQFMISWKAYNYSPSWYQGKNFPVYSSPVEISFELLEDNKIVNLSKNEIRWYINNNLFTKGNGLQTIRFIHKNQAGTNISVRIAVENYKGEELNKFVYIPVKNPEAIINAPYLTGKVKIGQTYQLKAFPFFFNASSLNDFSFNWTVNNQSTFPEENEETQDVLNLTISTSTPSGLELNINLTATNLLQTIEKVTKNLKLIVQ